MVRININEIVLVQLTPHGTQILEGAGRTVFFQPNRFGERRFQLWELMEIFGPHMHNGMNQIFVENTIVIGDSNEHV